MEEGRLTVSALAACCSGTLKASGDGRWKLSGSVCATRSTCTHMHSVMLRMNTSCAEAQLPSKLQPGAGSHVSLLYRALPHVCHGQHSPAVRAGLHMLSFKHSMSSLGQWINNLLVGLIAVLLSPTHCSKKQSGLI